MKKISILIGLILCLVSLSIAQDSIAFDSLDNKFLYNTCIAYKVNVSKDKIKYDGFVIDVRKQSKNGNFHNIFPVEKEYDSSDFFVPDIETIYAFEKKLQLIEKRHPIKRYVKRNYKKVEYFPIKNCTLENYFRQYFAYEYDGRKYLYVYLNLLEKIDKKWFTEEVLIIYFANSLTVFSGAPKFYKLVAIYDIEG